MLHQPAAGLHQPLLQTGQRPVTDRHRQRQSPPEVAEVVGNQTQPQPYLVGAEAMARKPRHLDRLLAFFYPLLGRAAFVVEAHHRAARPREVRDDEPTRGNNSPRWNSTFATTRRAVVQLAAW